MFKYIVVCVSQHGTRHICHISGRDPIDHDTVTEAASVIHPDCKYVILSAWLEPCGNQMAELIWEIPEFQFRELIDTTHKAPKSA